jgi:hypothetical protein
MFDRFRHLLVTRIIDPLGSWVDDHADLIVRVVFHRITRGIVGWLIALVTVGLSLSQAWESFNDGNRRDGNAGHCTIDFGGQWLMGAMLVEGHGRQLYHRSVQRYVLMGHYRREFEDPKAEQSDADKLMSYFMGSDSSAAGETLASFVLPLAGGADALASLTLTAGMQDGWTPLTLAQVTTPRIGGPLYPPINAVIYAPLGMMGPRTGYRVNQVLNLVWALVAALGVRYLSRGNIWTCVAWTLIVLYPGFKGSIHLGQNAALTLAILTWGWALVARDRPLAGGMVWGLLAFKPVWAAAFFLVPLLTFRFGTCLAMLGTGLGLAVLTLPLVGIQPWFDWLNVGAAAAELYKTDENWVHLSRDLLGIPRRWLLDFSVPSAKRDVVLPTVTRNMVFLDLAAATVLAVLYLRKRWPTKRLASPFALDNDYFRRLMTALWRWKAVLLITTLLGLAWVDWCFIGRYQTLLQNVSAGSIVGWSLFGGCLLLTAALPLLRPRQAQAATGTAAGFLLLGAWLACFHFMYYDVLLTVLPLFVLLAEPRRYLEPVLVALVPLKEPPGDFAGYYRAWPVDAPPPLVPLLRPEFRNVWVLSRMVPNLFFLMLVVEHLFPRIGLAGTITGMWLEPLRMTTVREADGALLVYRKVVDMASMQVTTAIYDKGHPFDTYLAMFLWLWCAFLWLRTPRTPPPAAKEPELARAPPMVGEPSEQIMER